MKHHIIAFEDKHGNLDFDRLVEELDKNVELGYINTKTKGDLTLYDYSNTCTYERAWNDATRISRGLVLDKVGGRVVALPFENLTMSWMCATLPFPTWAALIIKKWRVLLIRAHTERA